MRSQTVINLLQCCEVAPRLQLRYVFNLRVRLEHHQVVLRHHQVNVDHVLAHLPCLFTFLRQLQFDFLLAREDAAVRVA